MDEAQIRSKMQEVLSVVSADVGSVRTGRATSALVEDIQVNVYGGQQRLKINELATVTVSDPQTITIEPWDKSIIGEIRQGLLSANVGMNPVIAGEAIKISMPPMTSEDRNKYVRLLSTKLENGRVMVRQVRGDAMHEIKKSFESKEVSEDEKFGQEKRLQEITDEFIGKINEIGEKKKQELLHV